MGWTSSGLNEVAGEFVAACEPGMVVMEIGAAMGVAALAALRRGARVVANDLSREHLEALAQSCPVEDRARLELLPGRFPRNVRYAEASVDAILASNVLHFLTGVQLRKGIASFEHWLKPGGRVYIQAATPYMQPFAEFIPEYEQRQRQGEEFPGWMENARRYSNHGLLSQIPKSVHLLDEGVLRREFQRFEVERCWLYRRRDLSKTMWLDGRECVGLVARKPGA
jgi:cyclopropane fatty-acyl-phospholipid synthase-like methyltransferase